MLTRRKCKSIHCFGGGDWLAEVDLLVSELYSCALSVVVMLLADMDDCAAG